MGKYRETKKYFVTQKKLGLYVAESHYFDAKGKRQITLTDKLEFAEQMTLVEANYFISSEKNSVDYEVIEASETDETLEEYEDEEN